MEIPFEIKNMDEEKGTFVAYGSTFGNEDLGGDVVVKGAFTKSLKDTPASEVYMFYNHDTKEIIGEYTSIKEDEHGLLIEGKLFIDNIQRARETHFLMMKGLIKKFSIGFQTVKKGFESGKRMLKELKLIEVSPVTFPMNTEADLLGFKSMNTKGSNLVSILNDKIDEMTSDDDVSRADVVQRLASAARITTDTVNAILNQEINQPPMNRLRAFAKVLNVSLDKLEGATEDDDTQSPKRHMEDDQKMTASEIDDYVNSLSDIEFILRTNKKCLSKNASVALIAKVKKLSFGGEPQKNSNVGDPQSDEKKELEEARILEEQEAKTSGALDKLIKELKG